MSTEQGVCQFERIIAADPEGPLPDNIVPQVPEGATDEEATAILKRPVCSRECCQLTGQALTDLVLAAGRVAPAQVIKEQIPPDCAGRQAQLLGVTAALALLFSAETLRASRRTQPGE